MLPARGPAGYIDCLLLYYITDSHFYGQGPARFAGLLDRIAAAAEAGVDYIQLREKDLSARDLEALGHQAMQRIQGTASKLLINSRTDIAIVTGAHGVHLPANDISPTDARRIFGAAGAPKPTIAVSCHSADEVRRAQAAGADFVVFGPVFEKSGSPGVGLDRLREACAAAPLPVLALGGVTVTNTADCLRAGAQGIAAIRLFQKGDLTHAVRRLK